MKQIALAFQFLTVIPMTIRGAVSGPEMSRSAAFFPVVGAFQGALAVGAAFLSAVLFGGEIASLTAVMTLAASNGGFHLDGLADTFDAIAVKSTGDDAADIGRRLAVMKGGSAGPIGVISIVFAVFLKYLLLKWLFFNAPPEAFYCFLFIMPVYSRWAMVAPMYHGLSARAEGLGNMFIIHMGATTVVLSTFIALTISLLAAARWLGQVYGISVAVLLFILSASLYLYGFISAKYCSGKFGGLTGDVFGAISEVSEILFLLGVSVWLPHSI